jgi:hypothetical protein
LNRKESAMSYTITESHHYASALAGPARPSALAAWLLRAARRLVGRRTWASPAVPDRAREAAEVREWAMTIQRNDPRFAADLFAAADRHEREDR